MYCEMDLSVIRGRAAGSCGPPRPLLPSQLRAAAPQRCTLHRCCTYPPIPAPTRVCSAMLPRGGGGGGQEGVEGVASPASSRAPRSARLCKLQPWPAPPCSVPPRPTPPACRRDPETVPETPFSPHPGAPEQRRKISAGVLIIYLSLKASARNCSSARTAHPVPRPSSSQSGRDR